MMANEFDGIALRKRLDAMILLLLESSPRGAESTVSKIERLLELGFTQPEVAQMIGKKLNYVTAVISTKKRSGARAKGAGDEHQ
jgi:hypothetical protein